MADQTASGLQSAGIGGSQAQFGVLLQILTQIQQALQSTSTNSFFSVNALTGVGPYTVTAQSGTISVRPAVAAPSTVNIPAGGPYLIADGNGSAGADNITITPPSGYTIQGSATYTINTNWGSVLLVLDGMNFLTFI